MANKVTKSYSLDKDIYEMIQEMVEEERTNKSRVVNRILYEYKKEREKCK